MRYGIKITEDKKVKLEEAIEKANGRAKVRLGYYEDLMNAVQLIMKQFSISKRELEGCQFCVNSSPEDFPNAYLRKGSPASTYYYIQMHAGNWYLYDARRESCISDRIVAVTFTDTAKAAVINKYRKF